MHCNSVASFGDIFSISMYARIHTKR
jgi:hypothetical protein